VASAALVVVTCVLASSRASAQDEHRLRWSNDWARVHPAAYVLEGVGVAAALSFDQLYDPGPEAHLTGPFLFDGAFRDHLMAGTDEDRERAATASDILLAALLAWPAIDSIFVAGIGDENSDVFWQLSMVALEAAAADFVLGTFVKLLVHRERPHGSRCAVEDRETNPARCGTGGRTRSFYSGHASAAFSSAGVICISHANLPIYGSEAADAMACGAAMLTASIVGLLRVISDRHHASDVIFGSLVGLFTGLAMPYLLHYGWDPIDGVDTAATSGGLTSAPVLSYRGSF
jgi:membrane-associated phospholipid phosphatase